MTAFKIVNGLKITTNNEKTATTLRASFAASNAKLESALKSLFEPGNPPDPQPAQGTALGTNRNDSFQERVRTPKTKPSQRNLIWP